jgi:hypothetical protein
MCGKLPICLAWALSSFVAIAVRAGSCAEHPTEATAATPKVISVTQLTHDGVSKTNLLSDDSNLYVTERPFSGLVLAKFSLSGANRSVISSSFPNVQALDISPDRTSLLVSPVQGGRMTANSGACQ